MAGSVNKVILIGNLGADPEVRRTNDGRPVVNLRVATSDSWKRQDHRRAPRKDRVAPRRDLQRGPVQDRRAVPEEGLQGLSRRRAADPQVAGQGRPRQILDRGGAAGLQFARSPCSTPAAAAARRWPRTATANSARPAPAPCASASPQRPWPAASATTWTTRFRSNVLRVCRKIRLDCPQDTRRRGQ